MLYADRSSSAVTHLQVSSPLVFKVEENMIIMSIRILFILTMILLLTSCEDRVEKIKEPTKAIESSYNIDIRKATTSVNLTKADLAWHAVNTYGWDCEEVVSKDELNSDGYFCIKCSSGLKLHVYPRQGQHPKITNESGGYE